MNAPHSDPTRTAPSAPSELSAPRARAGRRLLMQVLVALVPVLAGCAAQRAHAGAYEDFFDAIARDDAPAVRLLLLRGVTPNSPDRTRGPALLFAVREKSFAAAMALLETPLTDVNVRNQVGETPLMYAALFGELPLVKRLIERGAQVNQSGWTALHYAASAGQLSVVQYLLDQHAFIDALSPNQTTPLMMAAREKHLSVAQLLIKEGADPSLRNEAGVGAAEYFLRSGDPQSAEWVRQKATEFLHRYGTKDRPVPAGGNR
ncbi:MAG TPA: ankyrin repeat domain-containing protein [Quisquiliibacterium sp.]|nr:ankyrin repeat domain-containing protein [Quisquiliibacterium sp.]HQN11574.1 ankyrin repeat domain-containing protein [Quisquiliibacterium sp.]HQP65793.1 ankyrin repeat domain-containing protein [Quisquiliibacterium sp.]